MEATRREHTLPDNIIDFLDNYWEAIRGLLQKPQRKSIRNEVDQVLPLNDDVGEWTSFDQRCDIMIGGINPGRGKPKMLLFPLFDLDSLP